MDEHTSPISAFKWGLVAGAAVVVVGLLAALVAGGDVSSIGFKILTVAPLIGGAVAAGAAAKARGALDSRIFIVSVAAFVCSFLLSSMLDFVLLFGLITSEDTMEKAGHFFWIRYLALSVLTVPVGAVIGMNFGTSTKI